MLTDEMAGWRDHGSVRWGTLLLLATSASAYAEPIALQTRWPSVPKDTAMSLEDQLTDHLTELGNTLGHHLDLLSHDMFALTVDGRNRRAHVHVGGGSEHYLSLRIVEDIQFDDLNARCHTHVDLGFHGHAMHFELPDFDVTYAEYHGDYGVQLSMPLFERKF